MAPPSNLRLALRNWKGGTQGGGGGGAFGLVRDLESLFGMRREEQPEGSTAGGGDQPAVANSLPDAVLVAPAVGRLEDPLGGGSSSPGGRRPTLISEAGYASLDLRSLSSSNNPDISSSSSLETTAGKAIYTENFKVPPLWRYARANRPRRDESDLASAFTRAMTIPDVGPGPAELRPESPFLPDVSRRTAARTAPAAAAAPGSDNIAHDRNDSRCGGGSHEEAASPPPLRSIILVGHPPSLTPTLEDLSRLGILGSPLSPDPNRHYHHHSHTRPPIAGAFDTYSLYRRIGPATTTARSSSFSRARPAPGDPNHPSAGANRLTRCVTALLGPEYGLPLPATRADEARYVLMLFLLLAMRHGQQRRKLQQGGRSEEGVTERMLRGAGRVVLAEVGRLRGPRPRGFGLGEEGVGGIGIGIGMKG